MRQQGVDGHVDATAGCMTREKKARVQVPTRVTEVSASFSPASLIQLRVIGPVLWVHVSCPHVLNYCKHNI